MRSRSASTDNSVVVALARSQQIGATRTLHGTCWGQRDVNFVIRGCTLRTSVYLQCVVTVQAIDADLLRMSGMRPWCQQLSVHEYK